MAKNKIPAFSDFDACARFFYDHSCQLDRSVSEYASKRSIEPGLNAKQQAKLYSGLLNLIDGIFELSCLFDDLNKIQTKKLSK